MIVALIKKDEHNKRQKAQMLFGFLVFDNSKARADNGWQNRLLLQVLRRRWAALCAETVPLFNSVILSQVPAVFGNNNTELVVTWR